MNFFDIKIAEFGSYVLTLDNLILIISLILAIYFYLRQLHHARNQINWKIQMVNSEIFECFKGPALGGTFPERYHIDAIISTKSKDYKIKPKKLYSVEDVINKLISLLYEQPIDSEVRIKWIKSLREETSVPLEEKEKLKKENIFSRIVKFLRSDLLVHRKYRPLDMEKMGKRQTKMISKILAKQKTMKEPEAIKIKKFYDDFEEFKGWQAYRGGTIVQSDEVKHSGNFSLKKVVNGDPHGGYKLIGELLSFDEAKEIIFTGWIYRPQLTSPNIGDRLAIENANFNGYGFTINHSRNTAWIERRDKGKPIVISPIININPLMNKWNRFEFHMKKAGKYSLIIFDEMGGMEATVSSFADNKYLSFTQIAMHGGFPYYIDDIKIEILK